MTFLLEVIVNQQAFWLREKNVFTDSFKHARRFKDARVAKNVENRLFSMNAGNLTKVNLQKSDGLIPVDVSRPQFTLVIDHESN